MQSNAAMSHVILLEVLALRFLVSLLLVISFENAVTLSIFLDPYADTSTPLRETMRDRHRGVTINVQLLDFQSSFMIEKFRNFEALTGATVQEVYSTQATWYDDVSDDIKNNNQGFIDVYASFGNWIPQFADMGGLMDLSDDILNAVGLDWFDIMPAVRMGSATYKGKVFAVPLDGDVIYMVYRKDLVEDVGLPTPVSWDDVKTILEYYRDKDINGDGIPDFGNCFSTAENDIADKIFWAIASSFLQTRGTSQGTFFDPITMDPASSTPEFQDVLHVYRHLVNHSPFIVNQTGVTWEETRTMFNQGRCVLFYNFPGPIKSIISIQKENGMSGVLNLAPLPGKKCQQTDYCPYASPEDGVNHAPFLAGGGMVYAMNSRSSVEKQQAGLDFALYLSDPGVSFWDVAHPESFLDPLRLRHTSSLANNATREAMAFLEFGWESRQLKMLKQTTEFSFLNGNYVLDLRNLGASAYQQRGTIPHLLRWCKGAIDAQETANEITKSWNAITRQYGLVEQRSFYRNVLGLPEYIDSRKEGNLAKLQNIIIGVTIPFGVIALFLSCIVAKQRRTIKFQTREVNNAPKTGTIALIFTDIEGSTVLWEMDKRAMQKALEIHHNVIRNCIEKYQAYEVKTVGDAFMIAVDSADKAVLLANDIQWNLLNEEWPLELAAMPPSCVEYFRLIPKSKEPPKPMFKGLRVRIGIHIGEHSSHDMESAGGQIQVTHDSVTKGYDYYGSAVNAAARIEDIGFGGQTVISQAVHEALSVGVKDSCVLDCIGEVELRGVQEKLTLYTCLPKQLRGRRFQGIYRRKQSIDHVFDVVKSERVSYKDVDVMTLTPVELQEGMKQLQETILSLETKLSSSVEKFE
mmetsp:Transcript_2561/g.4800  ORF Transcript_2561/g.4800 Transcript_2561/m.4800 type:complete len:860 (-) Transcript_2561:460-3039(-)